MFVRFLRPCAASANGLHTGYYEVGAIAHLPDRIAEGLIADGFAEQTRPQVIGNPLVAYLHSRRPVCGSAYKFGTMLRRVAPGPVVIGSEEDHGRFLDEHRPDMVVVRGDHRRHHRGALRRGIPYLLVAHDIAGLRAGTGLAPDEREMFERAAAVLFVSEACAEWTLARADLREYAVVNLRPLREQLAFVRKPTLARTAVYAGNLLGREFADTPWQYRVCHDQFRAFIEQGWSVHVYPSHVCARPTCEEYAAIGCVVHEPVPEARLLQELSQYEIGLNIHGAVVDQIMHTSSNKTWLYLGAGIPTVGINAGPSGEIYEGHWGLLIKHPKELKRRRMPVLTDELRFAQVMDGDLPVFERLVAAALAG